MNSAGRCDCTLPRHTTYEQQVCMLGSGWLLKPFHPAPTCSLRMRKKSTAPGVHSRPSPSALGSNLKSPWCRMGVGVGLGKEDRWAGA